MRCLPPLLGACLVLGLPAAWAAAAPFPIVDVIRKGEPPFPPGGQIYVLTGGRDRGLRPGALLAVRRPGTPLRLGWLRVMAVGAVQAEARLERAGSTYLLKGDLATRVELGPLPAIPRSKGDRLAAPAPPDPGPQAPPWEGLLFFLPQRDDLSPAGRQKLTDWVAAWGAGGRWAVQVPTAKGLSPDLQRRRTEALRAALQALGVPRVEADDTPRRAEGRYDPAWVRHWD